MTYPDQLAVIRKIYGRGVPADPVAECERLRTVLAEIVGCFEKAASEGLGEKLREQPLLSHSPRDILERRILPVHQIALKGLKR